MRTDYDISEVRPYINWAYFYHAWGVAASKPQVDEQDLRRQRDELRAEAERVLDAMEGRHRAHSLVLIVPAASDGDDIVLPKTRLPMLRQQQTAGPSLCMADFLRPLGMQKPPTRAANGAQPLCNCGFPHSLFGDINGRFGDAPAIGTDDHIGLFAASIDEGFTRLEDPSDDYRRMLLQTLADRLAEATAERLHQQVRRQLWGYAPHERLTISELHQEHFQGIRPAVGYPSLPDMSLNFELDRLLDMGQIGIRLTETGMMQPHASVSGLMLAHPAARYFDVGPIGDDQLADYARRRQMTPERMRAFLKTQ